MKKILVLAVSIILVLMLCACSALPGGNENTTPAADEINTEDTGIIQTEPYTENTKTPLTAKNFTLLSDSDGILYALDWFDCDPVALAFEGTTDYFKFARLSDELDADYGNIASASEWAMEVYGDKVIVLGKADGWNKSYTLGLAYADPDGDYVIFTEEAYSPDCENLLQYTFTCLRHDLLKKVYSGMDWANQPTTIAEYAAYIDSCK